MFELSGLLGLVVLALDIWAILHVAGSSASQGAKVFWIVLIIVLPVVGFLIWLVAGPRKGII
ncbi:MAG TPA: PLD nuclease N-terminal domain-containing protein [Alphaproteobacteria bacterium]|nr:PLD nuclease N-terminal domain-containing protein [Alphaproteobacteria bacterium]